MKVLLPIDNSDCAQLTLKWAVDFLDKTNCQIYLLDVLLYTQGVEVTDYEKDEAVKILKNAKAFFEKQGFRVEKAEWMIDEPVKGICGFADEREVDQIIIGSHGRQGLAKFLLGSVSEGVFRNAKQPVIVINNGHQSSLKMSHLEEICLTEH